MTYKKFLCGISTLAVCCMLTGCHMKHEWLEATCTTPKTCSACGETEGEALDGHEWKAVTCTVIFDDENAYYHGYSGIFPATIDYYDATFFDNYKENKVSFTANYNGIEYDGIVMAIYNPSIDWNNGNDYEIAKSNDDTILFQLK